MNAPDLRASAGRGQKKKGPNQVDDFIDDVSNAAFYNALFGFRQGDWRLGRSLASSPTGSGSVPMCGR